MARALTRLGDLPFAERVRELTTILDEDGYLASWERVAEDRWRIVEHNCAVLDVAQRYRSSCSSELSFLQEAMPDARIERVAHMMAGAHVCAYEVRPVAA